MRENSMYPRSFDADQWLDRIMRQIKKKHTIVKKLESMARQMQGENDKLRNSCQKKHLALWVLKEDLRALSMKMIKAKTESTKQIEALQFKLNESTKQVNKLLCQLEAMEIGLELYKMDNKKLKRQKVCTYCRRSIVSKEVSFARDSIDEEKNEELRVEDCKVFTAENVEQINEMKAIVSYMSNPTVEAYKKLTFNYHRQLEYSFSRIAERTDPHTTKLNFPRASFYAAKVAEAAAGKPEDLKHNQSFSQSFRNGVSCTCADNEESCSDVKKFKDCPQSSTKRVYGLQGRNTCCTYHTKKPCPVELQPVPLAQMSQESVANGCSCPSTSTGCKVPEAMECDEKMMKEEASSQD